MENGTKQQPLVVKIKVPCLNFQRILPYELHHSILDIKQILLENLCQPLDEALNYGLYLPPGNGYIGGFLNEQIRVIQCNFNETSPALELRYKRRVYRDPKTNIKNLKEINSVPKQKRFLAHVHKGHVAKVKSMCDKGIDPNFHETLTGDTPLIIATKILDPSDLIETLVKGGAHIDFRAKTTQSLSPLHVAAQMNKAIAVKKLLELGAFPNVKDAIGLTPLHHLLSNQGDPLCAKLLLENDKGYTLEVVSDQMGWQEIHYVCRYGQPKILDMLIANGADINSPNKDGETPLHIAAIHNQNDCVCLLLNKGANPLIANLAGRTPSQTATEYGNHELATFIANYSMRLSHNPSSIIDHHQNSFKTPPYVHDSNSAFPFLNAATTSTKYLNNNNSSLMSNAKYDDTIYENSLMNTLAYNNSINNNISNLNNYNPITSGNDNIQLNNLNMNHGPLHISTNRILDNDESETFKTFRNIGSDEHSIPANTNNLDSPLLSLLSTEDKNSSSVTSGKGSSLNSDDLNQQSSLEEICNAIRLDTDDTDGYSVNPSQNFTSCIAKNLNTPLLNSLVQNNNKSVCKQSDQHNQEAYTMIATTSVESPSTACKVSFNPNPNHPPPPENIVARLFDRAVKETDPISETVKTTRYADNTSGSCPNPELSRPKTFSPSPSITNQNVNDGLISFRNSQLSLINNKEQSDKTNNFMATRHNSDCLSKNNLDLSGKYISQSSNIMLKHIASDLAQRVVFLHRGIKGYGFILTGPKNIPQTLSEQSPHVILRVELNSPAHQADLKEGDHIIEVNGVHIQFLSHGQVSKLIAQNGSEKPLTMTVLTQRRPPSNNPHLANEINKDRTHRNMNYLSLSNNQYHYSPTHTLNKNKNDKNDLHFVANRFGTFNGKSAHKISLSPLYNNGNDDWKMQTLPTRMNKKFWGHEPPNKSPHLTNPLGVGFYNIPGTAPLIHQSIPSNLHMLHDGHTPVNHTFTNIPSELKYGSINSRLTRKFGSHYNSLINDNTHPQNLTFNNNSMMGSKPMNYEANEALHMSYVDLPSGIFNGKKNNKKENKNASGLNSSTPFKFFSLGRSNSSKASAKYYKEFNKYVNGTGFNGGLTFGPNPLSTSSLTSSKMPDRYKKRYNKSLLPTSWAFTLSESELTPDTLHHQQDSKICGNVQSRFSMDLSNDIYSIPENGQLSQKDLNKMENMVPNYNQNQQKVSLNSIKLMSSPSPVMQYVQAYPIFIEHHNQMTNPHNFLETQKALEDSIMAHNRNGISSNHIQLNNKSVAFDLNSNQIIQVNANKKPTKGHSLESNLISPQSYPIPPPFQAPKPHIILPDDQNCRNSIEQFSINPIMVGNSDEPPMTGSLKILNQHLQQAQINKIHNKNQFLPTETNNEPSTLNERSGCEIKCNLPPHMERPEENQKMTLRKCETDELKSKGVAANDFGNKSPSLLEELVQSPLVQKLRDINIKSESIGMTDNENNTDETKLKSNKLKSSLTTTESECENDALIDNDHSVRNESNGSPLETEKITEQPGTVNNYSNTSETNANQHSALLNEIHTFFQQKNNLIAKPTTNTTSTESDDNNLENLTTLNIQEKVNLNESHINNNEETITCNLKQGECKKVQSDDSNLLQRKKNDVDPNAIYSIPKPSNKRQNQSKDTDTSEPLTNGANINDDHFDINVKRNDKIDLNDFDSENISKNTTQENGNHPLETLGKSCVNGIKRRHLFKPSLKFSRSSKPQRLTKHGNPPNIEVAEVHKKGKCNPKKQNIPNSKAFKEDIHPRYINATRSLQRLSCPDFNVIAQCPAMIENQNFQGEYYNALGVEKRIPTTAPQNSNCNGPNGKSNSLVSRKAIVDRNRFSLAFNTPSNFNSKGNKIQPPFAHILSTPAAFIQNDLNLTTAFPINNEHFVNNQMPYAALYSNNDVVENNLLSHNYPAVKYKIKGKIDKNYKVYP